MNRPPEGVAGQSGQSAPRYNHLLISPADDIALIRPPTLPRGKHFETVPDALNDNRKRILELHRDGSPASRNR